jgi:hypothetical protein
MACVVPKAVLVIETVVDRTLPNASKTADTVSEQAP